jgi:uncharacterized membrane protein YebE (DUF533 family)
VSIQSEVGEAVGRFADTISAQAVADPSAVGSVALSAAGVLAGGVAWWWRKHRNRERHSQRASEARFPVSPDQDVEFRTSKREQPKGA